MEDSFTIRARILGMKEVAAESEMGAKAVAKPGEAAAAANAKAKTSMASLAKTATTLRTTGRALTHYVTLPVIGIGVAAGAMSLSFQRSMSLISTQAGGSKREVASLSGEVLDLARSSEFGPQTLAEGLFHIESVGYRGAKAMKVLNSAQQLASVGNADLEATTNALVGAMRTGITGTQNMHQEIGTLNATIGAGNLRMNDLTAALGTGFLVNAKQVGLSLRDAGAALAEMTSQGVPATASATRLRMTFTLMAAPTEKAQKALKSIGLGSSRLAEEMQKPNGLVRALKLLKDHLGSLSGIERTQLLSEAFGGARSGTTIMALLGQLGDLNTKYQEIGENADNFDQKLKETEQQPLVKLQKAWNNIQADLIELGTVILPAVVPMFETLTSTVSGLGHWFAGLPEPVQTTLAGLLGITALAGPMMIFAARVLDAAKNLGILQATGGGGIALNKGGLARGAAGIAGVGAVVGGQAIGGTAGNLISGVGGGAALGTMVSPGVGTAVGAGLGALLAAAPMIASLFSSTPKISQMRNATEHLTGSFGSYERAAKAVSSIETRVDRARHRHTAAIRQERSASHHLTEVLAHYGVNSIQATRAQLGLSRAQAAVVRTSKAEQHMNQLSGFRLKAYRLKMREVVGEIKALIPQQKNRIRAMREEVNHGRTSIGFLTKLEGLEMRVGKEKRKLTRIYGEADQKGSKPFAESLAKLNPMQAEAAVKAHEMARRVHDLKESMANLSAGSGRFAYHIGGIRLELEKATRQLEHFQEVARSGMGGGLGKPPQVRPPGQSGGGSGPIPGPRPRHALMDPRPALVVSTAGSDNNRIPLRADIHIDRHMVASVVTEAREDAEARL